MQPANGWKVTKRPGVDEFLSYLSQMYELVVFTTGWSHVSRERDSISAHAHFFSSPKQNAAPIIEKLDPFQYVVYKLFKEHTTYQNQNHVKDISKLNRDLAKVVMIDTNPASVSLGENKEGDSGAEQQPGFTIKDNVIMLKPWDGNSNDRTLFELIDALEGTKRV